MLWECLASLDSWHTICITCTTFELLLPSKRGKSDTLWQKSYHNSRTHHCAFVELIQLSINPCKMEDYHKVNCLAIFHTMYNTGQELLEMPWDTNVHLSWYTVSAYSRCLQYITICLLTTNAICTMRFSLLDILSKKWLCWGARRLGHTRLSLDILWMKLHSDFCSSRKHWAAWWFSRGELLLYSIANLSSLYKHCSSSLE